MTDAIVTQSIIETASVPNAYSIVTQNVLDIISSPKDIDVHITQNVIEVISLETIDVVSAIYGPRLQVI